MHDHAKFRARLRRDWELYQARGAGVLTFLVRKIQGLPAYRRLARKLRPAFIIAEVDREVQVPWSADPWPPAPGVTSYAARSRETVLGLVHLLRYPPGAFPYGYWLHNLRICPLCRRMGLGAALVQRVIDRARQENAPELFCLVTDDNLPALELYQRLGFRRAWYPPFEARQEQEKQSCGTRRFLLRKVLG
jgi:GNAT superfamily N-acetyltransferase